jgi:hypothetical protein
LTLPSPEDPNRRRIETLHTFAHHGISRCAAAGHGARPGYNDSPFASRTAAALTSHHHAWLNWRGSRNVHAVVRLDMGALALDAMTPAEQPFVMVSSGVWLSTRDRVARLVIAGGCHHRRRNG